MAVFHQYSGSLETAQHLHTASASFISVLFNNGKLVDCLFYLSILYVVMRSSRTNHNYSNSLAVASFYVRYFLRFRCECYFVSLSAVVSTSAVEMTYYVRCKTMLNSNSL